MSNLTINKIESALMEGDLSRLTEQERLSYYNKVCESLGLNPLTQPFAYIKLNGKLLLYAKRDATDQLRKIHKVSITLSGRDTTDGVLSVTARARDASGREDESTGTVFIHGLKGDALANAYLKAETKAKRRVTLSICGLGLLDETEAEPLVKDAHPSINKLATQLENMRVKQPEVKHEPRDGTIKDGLKEIALSDITLKSSSQAAATNEHETQSQGERSDSGGDTTEVEEDSLANIARDKVL